MKDNSQDEMLDLVRLEYERTTKFIEGTVGISTTVRGWAITVWAALLGIGFTQKTPVLALLAGFALLAFAVVDLYHTSLYRQALLRARRLERITARHYEALARGRDNPKAVARAAATLAANRYGFYTNLRSMRISDLFSAGPRVFLIVYAVLAAAAVASASIIPGLP